MSRRRLIDNEGLRRALALGQTLRRYLKEQARRRNGSRPTKPAPAHRSRLQQRQKKDRPIIVNGAHQANEAAMIAAREEESNA